MRRPYPKDSERRRGIRIELALRDMTVSDLAKVLKMPASVLSEVVNGRRLSRKTEEKIAAFFGKSREELFPGRSLYDLMLLSEQEKRGA